MTRSIPGILAALALVSLVGCGEEPAAAAPTAASAAPKKKVEAPAPVVAQTTVDYVYNPVNKRDPFRSFIVDPSRKAPDQTEQIACTEPLCLVDLDELAVVAVVSGDANPLAMVEDRQGVGHIVRRNTRMGKQGGKVTQILRDCLVVTSFVSGGADGKPIANKQNMCVKSDQRSVEPLDLLKGKEFTQ